MPTVKENKDDGDGNSMSSPPSIHTIESTLESPNFKQLQMTKTKSTVFSIKQEYIKKLKEH